MKNRIKALFQKIALHGRFIVTILFIGVGVLLIWFLVSGFAPSMLQISIGIATLSAFFAAISSISNLFQAVETERQRRNQERPYIIAYFDASGNSLIHFIVENSGNSPAINVKLSIAPVPTDYAGRKLSEVSFFSQPISFIPAGKKIRQMIDVGPRFLALEKPVCFEIDVEYSSVFGEGYKEKVHQNLEYLRQTTVPIKSIEENLAEILKELKGLNSSINNVIKFNSFQVETPEQHDNRMQRLFLEAKDTPGWRKRIKVFLFDLSERL